MKTHIARLRGKRCQCSVCGEFFGSVTSFDKHRKGEHSAGSRHCLDPETAGLVIRETPAGTFWAGAKSDHWKAKA